MKVPRIIGIIVLGIFMHIIHQKLTIDNRQFKLLKKIWIMLETLLGNSRGKEKLRSSSIRKNFWGYKLEKIHDVYKETIDEGEENIFWNKFLQIRKN